MSVRSSMVGNFSLKKKREISFLVVVIVQTRTHHIFSIRKYKISITQKCEKKVTEIVVYQ